MILLKDSRAQEQDFVLLLEKTKNSLLKKINSESSISFSEFEGIVCSQMNEEARGTEFYGLIEQTSQYAFPDIVAKKYYGVEVKHTVKDHWRSTGNSILESNRVEGTERIYMFFGKFGGKVDIIFRLYQECLLMLVLHILQGLE